jgi:hypothetical protein
MVVSILLCAVVSSWSTPERLTELRHLRNDALIRRAMQGRVDEQAEFDRSYLYHLRLSVAFTQERIAQIQWLLGLLADSLTPNERQQMLQYLDKELAELPQWQKHLELLEWADEQRRLNPGPKTEKAVRKRLDALYDKLFWPIAEAPAPRPVLRP